MDKVELEELRSTSAWLIEMIHNDAPMPRYWNSSKYKGGWVWDAFEAMRFCREQDARDFLDGLSLPLQGRPVEHVFIGEEALRTPAIEDGVLREALEKIAALNDLSEVADDDLESAARGALYECELIARQALSSKPAEGWQQPLKWRKGHTYNCDHPLLAAILTIRRKNAGDFSPTQRKGNEFEAYDQAVLDCYHAIEAVMTAALPAAPKDAEKGEG